MYPCSGHRVQAPPGSTAWERQEFMLNHREFDSEIIAARDDQMADLLIRVLVRHERSRCGSAYRRARRFG
jgi:hypothetical protein